MDQYLVNIALNGRHWGRVELRDETRDSAIIKARQIRAVFPERAGYKVSMTVWQNIGRDVEL